MVKSAPMRDHSIVIKPRRRAARGIGLLLLIVILSSAALLGSGFFIPARLAIVQERVVAVFHGGVVESEERTFVDACVAVEGADGPQAVTRTVRTTTFGDGTSIAVTYSSLPTPTNSTC
jgi:hypothetical protein